ncbi:hypothetical protein ABZ705_21370 [Streptomyces sp. NPDC006984]|uniref:hypothetical protein n=1 Tax=Streptomyces sp. NPDC006984 TaxID=3155463 RepID=UPI0033CD0B0F
MTRPLPDPHTVLGYRRDGRPIYPVLGASSADPSNDDATLTLSQKQLNALLAREKDQGGRAAVRALVEKLGFSINTDLTDFVTRQRQTEQDQLTETQRREQDLTTRENAIAAREAQAAAREREASRRAVLAREGSTGEDLDDALTLLRIPDDADDTAVSTAVHELKTRRPELFRASAPGGGQPPAAPGGAPASVPPPRPGSTDRKPGSAGIEMARRRGLIPPAP